MSKELKGGTPISEIPEDKRKKNGYNIDYEVEWIGKFAEQRKEKGLPAKSIVNHQMAYKLENMKRAKITKKDVKRTLPEDPNQKKKK